MLFCKTFKGSKAPFTPLHQSFSCKLFANPANSFHHHRTRCASIPRYRRHILPFIAVLPFVTARLACGFNVGSVSEMSQDRLVNDLVAEGVVRTADVEAALRAIDRGAFCPKGLPKHYIYQDSPLPIGYGETISAPHMHATCLELLRPHLRPGGRVLDVGSGSGYLSAALGILVRPNGKVIGIEKHPELADYSIARMREYMPEMLESGLVELKAGNVLGDALENEEPFDAIHVGAAAPTLPDVLVQKLKPGGRMVIPVGPQYDFQVLQVVDKDLHGKVKKHNITGVRYVPLTKPGEE